eukprot:GSA120T00020430001.1
MDLILFTKSSASSQCFCFQNRVARRYPHSGHGEESRFRNKEEQDNL